MSFILMIDDNDDHRELLTLAAQSLVIEDEVVTVDSGARAIELLQARADAPSLVLVDVKMPGMDGPDTVRRLRDLPALDHVPVIMLSTSDDASDVRRSRAAGANSYVRKPHGDQSWSEILAQLIAFWKGRDAHWSVRGGQRLA